MAIEQSKSSNYRTIFNEVAIRKAIIETLTLKALDVVDVNGDIALTANSVDGCPIIRLNNPTNDNLKIFFNSPSLPVDTIGLTVNYNHGKAVLPIVADEIDFISPMVGDLVMALSDKIHVKTSIMPFGDNTISLGDDSHRVSVHSGYAYISNQLGSMLSEGILARQDLQVSLGGASNRWLNVFLQVLKLNPSATPSNPVEGDVYYDSTAHKLKVRGATGWETITSV